MDNAYFKQWIDDWDNAVKSGIFEKTLPETQSLNQDHLVVWKQILHLEPELLTEASKEDLSKAAEIIANSPNPISPTTLGQDSKLKVTPNWTSGKELEALAELKQRLYDLEVKLGEADTKSDDPTALEKQFEKLKQDMDDLSNSLTPDMVSQSES